MLDFTSSLYLGFEHSSFNLPAWPQLTLGKPAALQELPDVPQVEQELAALVGCERALVAPSTLHLFWDLFGVLGDRNIRIFLDQGSYPIVRWGVERAAAAGVPVHTFPRHDVQALRYVMNGAPPSKPVVVTDGFCPGSGAPAPLPEYLDCAFSKGGLLVVDDTQALGIFGSAAGASSPYGKGGGGSLQKLGLRHPGILVVSSLAKAFGVPIAMLGGSTDLVERFRANSKTRMHCSPPSAAELGAARHALKENRRMGDSLRAALGQSVAYFRRGLKAHAPLANSGLFPVQSLRLPGTTDVRAFYLKLLHRGVKPVLLAGAAESGVKCSFVFNARHRLSDIDKALEATLQAMALPIKATK